MATTNFLEDAYPGVETRLYQVQVQTPDHIFTQTYFDLHWTDGPTASEARAARPRYAEVEYRKLVREYSVPTRILGLVLIHAGILPLRGGSVRIGSDGSGDVLRSNPSTGLVRETLLAWLENLNEEDFRQGLSPDMLDRLEIFRVILDGFVLKTPPRLNIEEASSEDAIREEMAFVAERWEDTLLFLDEERRLAR